MRQRKLTFAENLESCQQPFTLESYKAFLPLCDETQKNQIVMKLKNPNCDETQKLKLW